MKHRPLIEIGAPLLLALCALALMAMWRAPAQAWLVAYAFWAGLPVGALFLVLVHGLTGGQWGLTLRPALAGLLRTLPLLALFLVPLLFGLRSVYPWAAQRDPGVWLAVPFFAVRAVIYVVLWNAIALMASGRAAPDGRLPPGFAWPALILLFGSTTLAAFDWLMSLEPGWTSTIYGLLVTAGWVLGGTAAAILVTLRYPPPPRALQPGALDGPSRILLALVFLWAYLSVVQLIVIWESNLSSEIPWYLRRAAGGWQWVAAAIAIVGFVVPFVTLAWRPLRRWPAAVAVAASCVLAAHLAESWWLTLPDLRPVDWLDPVAVAAMGAAFVVVGGRDLAAPEAAAADGNGAPGDA